MGTHRPVVCRDGQDAAVTAGPDLAATGTVGMVGTHPAPPVACEPVKEADRVTGHNVRVEDGLWATFGRRAKAAGYGSRTAALVAFMRWYCRMPGAKLPQRPDENFE